MISRSLRSRRVFQFGLGLLAGSIALAQAPRGGRIEIPNAAQPQVAATTNGRVYLVYGHAGDVFVARSDDDSATFATAAKVATLPKLMLGMRRGPRIAAHGDDVTVTVVAPELLAFHSSDGGRSWSGPVTINEVPTSAREGLHDLAAGPEGRVFVTWLDLRNGKTELWGAESTDGGRTWGRNAPVYRSPDKSICECCHPTALFDSRGNLAVMWRNSIGGSRDMWLATRTKGTPAFGPAGKLGEGTWELNACPMDGGRIVDLGDGELGTVWQRAGEVFFAPAKGAEVSLGKGKQPVGITRDGAPFVVFQQGADLVSTRVAGKPDPIKHATDARFAVLVPLANGRGAVLAYEQGPAKSSRVVIERL